MGRFHGGKGLTTHTSHLRIDISGGTLDLWPLYHLVDGAKTVNAPLNLHAKASVKIGQRMKDPKGARICISNLNYDKKFSTVEELLVCNDEELAILQPVLKIYPIPKIVGLEVITESQSPVGGGLGGSSTLLVALLKAFDAELKILRTEEDYVTLACGLESAILKSPAGTQDYYQAIEPGLSCIEYSYEGRRRTFFKSPWLEKHKKDFMLIYSGHPHHSGLNNWNIYQAAINKDPVTLKVLQGLKDVSEHIYQDLQTAEGSQMQALLEEELKLRTELASGYVNEPLSACIEILKAHSVKHFKICGAGGGGCLWAIVPEDLRSQLNFGTHAQIIECEMII